MRMQAGFRMLGPRLRLACSVSGARSGVVVVSIMMIMVASDDGVNLMEAVMVMAMDSSCRHRPVIGEGKSQRQRHYAFQPVHRENVYPMYY